MLIRFQPLSIQSTWTTFSRFRRGKQTLINFDDARLSFHSKSTRELVRSYIVLSFCQIPALVKYSESLVSMSYKIFGHKITNSILQSTFFGHFCGGETEEDVIRSVKLLESSDLKGIWSYSAEGTCSSADSMDTEFDRNEKIFLRAIDSASQDSKSFIAMKLSAVFDAHLLAHISSFLLSIPNFSGETSFLSLIDKMAASEILTASLSSGGRLSYGRISNICKLAAAKSVRILIDAEQSNFQKAVEFISVDLCRVHNREAAIVFCTYQLYLRETIVRLCQEISQAEQDGYYLGCKLVRGAYMKYERDRASTLGLPDPIWASIHETHQAYDQAIITVLEEVQRGSRLEVMVATHNLHSVESCIACMNNLGVDKTKVFFGQLFGMKDYITYALGSNHYQAYKLIPYGHVEQVLPYLVRRAQENGDIFSGVGKERRMILHEIVNRLAPKKRL